MPIQITLSEDAAKDLNRQAQAECTRAVERYADDLLREAGRLEATARTAAGNPEVTSSMIKDADLLMRRGYSRPRRHAGLVIAQIVAPIGGIVTGLLADMEKLKNPATLITFVFLLVLTITTTVVVVLKD